MPLAWAHWAVCANTRLGNIPTPGSPRSPLSSVHTVAVTGRGINNKIRGNFHNIRIRRLLAPPFLKAPIV